MMRAPTIPTLLLSFALAGCNRNGASDVLAPPAPALFSAKCTVTFDAPPSPPPAVLRQVDTGTCQMLNIGEMRFAGVQDIDFAAGTQRGERSFTAANGDVLRATNVGTSAPSGPGLISFDATFTFTGGTGRFQSATGQVHGVGTANLATRTTVLTLDGFITYRAAGTP
jgi:hypothetical protein